MTATLVGTLSVGATIPAATAAAAAGAGGIDAAFPDISARLDALNAQIAALATLPPLPDFAAMLAKANALVASMTLAIATPGLPPPPSIATSIAALLDVVTDLTVMTAQLNVQAGVIAAFQAQLGAAGVVTIAHAGAVGTFGTETQAVLSSQIPSGNINALTLATADPATWAAMSAVFQVTP